MKGFLSIIIILLLSTDSWGQTIIKATCTDSSKSQIEESISFYLDRLSLDSTDQLSYSKIGMAYYKLKNLEKAIENFDKLISLNPNYPGALSNRGLCKLLLNNNIGACNDFKLSVKSGHDPLLIGEQKLSEWIKLECIQH